MTTASTKTFVLTNEQRAARVAAGVSVVVALGTVCALIAALHPGNDAPLFLPLGVTAFAVVFVPLFVVLRRVVLRVYDDGLVVREGGRRETFVAYDSLLDVSSDGPSVVLTLRGAQSKRYDVTPEGIALTTGALGAARRERASAVAAEVRLALRAHRAVEPPDAGHTASLDRSSRAATDWLRSLRRVGDGGVPTFRDKSSPTRDELLAIATSPRAEPSHRVAAAVAMHAGLTGEETPRIRVSAAATGAPRLGERLVRVLEATSESELAAVLDEEAARPR